MIEAYGKKHHCMVRCSSCFEVWDYRQTAPTNHKCRPVADPVLVEKARAWKKLHA